jgi:hypothetical protein
MTHPGTKRGVTMALFGLVATATALIVGPLSAFPAAIVGSAAPQTTGAPPSSPLCSPTLLTQVKAQVMAGLTGRATQLATLQTAASDPTNHLTTADRQTLQSDIGTVDLPGIQGLEPTVQQAATCSQLRQAAHAMVFDYRVYYVMTPQTYLTIAIDGETFVEGIASGFEPSLAAAIATAQARGKNVSSAQVAEADFQRQVAAAQAASSGLAAQVLAQSPQTWPAAWQVFAAALTGATNAHTDLEAAYGDALQIKGDLA